MSIETHTRYLRKPAGFTVRSVWHGSRTRKSTEVSNSGHFYLSLFPAVFLLVSVSPSLPLSPMFVVSLFLYKHLFKSPISSPTTPPPSWFSLHPHSDSLHRLWFCFVSNSAPWSSSPSAPHHHLQPAVSLISKSGGKNVALGLCHVSFTFHSCIICHRPTRRLNFTSYIKKKKKSSLCEF